MNLRDLSKKGWDANGSLEEINAGSLQRIADATELMANNHRKLIDDYEYMKKQRDKYRILYEEYTRKLANRQGQITKLKKKINQLESTELLPKK